MFVFNFIFDLIYSLALIIGTIIIAKAVYTLFTFLRIITTRLN